MTAKDPLKIWTWEGKVAAAIFGLGLLAWPMFSYGAIFVFDSPIGSRRDELQRYAFVYLTWGYPVLFALGWFGYQLLRKKRASRPTSLLARALPAITPLYYLYFLGF